jgi:hypothetical protein
MDLSGEWDYEIDPDDHGRAEAWYSGSLRNTLRLPGSLQAQGFGEEISVDTDWTGSIFDDSWYREPRYEPYRQPGKVKVPFWLQPDTHYQGAAWYARTIEIPVDWQGRRITLMLERPHWETQVWLDDREIGRQDSLSTPHIYELAGAAAGTHRLSIRVDNRMIVPVGPNAHSVSDHTQTNWNGIVGRIELSAGSPVWVEDLQVYPDVARKRARVAVRLGNALARAGQGRLTVQAQLRHPAPAQELEPVVVQIDLGAEGALAEVDYSLGEHARLWDEFDPALYSLSVELDATVDGQRYTDRRTTSFGLREVHIQGTQLAINGRTIFLRGTLECCIFPLTGYPPTDEASWRRIIQICQAHGLNHMRFHSWCPPEAAFRAADELGMYYQIECAAWANQGATIGDGAPLDAWLYEEGRRITAAYGNHPSFIMMAYGNEPAGEHHEQYLGEWVRYWKTHEPRRLHTTGAGWPALPENHYHNIPAPRIQAWGAGINSRINALPPETRTDYSDYVRQLNAPIVSHEIGQWCVYPNFAEIDKYTGALKAKNFEIFRDRLEAQHMGDQAHDFLIASGKLQTLCYKEEIESALRTPGFAGFQLLDLHDFPGQGTALVGVLDPFWEPKGYVTADQYRRFCNSTVPLARLAKRYWRVGEALTAAIEIAHFGPAPLEDATIEWRLIDDSGAAVAAGALAPATIAIGNGQPLGTIEADLSGCAPARKYTLVVGVAGTAFENEWDIWVFADHLEAGAPDDILIADQLDDTALARLGQGGRVLLMLRAEQVRTDSQIGFSSIFWNTAWTRNQAPHTLGILCDPGHPAFDEFPTERHSNWQWWELIHGAAAMTLDHLPADLRPLVQPIDTWFENRRLGLLFEARAGGGSLLVCSIDLRSDLDDRLVARQMRRSLLGYMSSERFNPRHTLDLDAIRAITR